MAALRALQVLKPSVWVLLGTQGLRNQDSSKASYATSVLEAALFGQGCRFRGE